MVEKIAEEGVRLYAFPNLWNRLTKTEKDGWREWAKNRIIPLLKKAGWIDPSTVIMPGEFGTPKAEEVLAEWAKANGWELKIQ